MKPTDRAQLQLEFARSGDIGVGGIERTVGEGGRTAWAGTRSRVAVMSSASPGGH
jgi:hypothetical protein